MTGHGFDSNARKTNSSLAFVTFFKSLFGAGLLALPNVLGRVGLVLGAFIYLCVALGCAFSCYLLLRAREVTAEYVLKEGHHHHHNHHGSTSSKDRVVQEYLRGHSNSVYMQQHDMKNGGAAINIHDVKPHHLVTYGDLADVLLGHTMASITRWTIIVLNILFTAGLVIVICENLGSFLSGEDDSDDMSGRHMVGFILLPLVAALVQIPWLQDMWVISAIGLLVYTVGVVGSSLYSALWTIIAGEASGRSMPTDLWEFKWDGVGIFMGSAVYALEGINLALPTVHSMQHPNEASWVVCGALMLYGMVTLVFAAVGYAGGLGGGEGTGLSAQDCDVVTNCITPSSLQTLIQVTLSIAMMLSIPVMLYPSTEMLEVMLTDRMEEKEEHLAEWRQQNALQSADGVELQPYNRSESETQLVNKNDQGSKRAEYSQQSTASSEYGTSRDSHLLNATTTNDSNATHQQLAEVEEEFSQDKSWKLRLFLSVLTVTLGGVMKSFTYFSGFVGAVGLSFAGFVLPPFLYLLAMQRADLHLPWGTAVGMALLVIFGLYNMIVGGASNLMRLVQSFT